MLMSERLKAARKECKLTQQQISDILGIDRSTYAYYELGVSNPSIDNLIALASIFNTDVTWLMGADKKADSWSMPEGELAIMRQVKERNMTELSKAERMAVAAFRIASRNGNQQELMKLLIDAAGKMQNEE